MRWGFVIGVLLASPARAEGDSGPPGSSCIETIRVWLLADGSKSGCPEVTSNLGSGTLLSVYCHLKTLIRPDEIERCAQVPMFLPASSEALGPLEVTSATSFRHYNPDFVRWARTSLIPRARDAATCRRLKDVYQNTVAGTARTYHRAYKMLADKPPFARAETARYLRAIARGVEDPADLGRLYGRIQDEEIDGHVAASALSFWIRRGIDGTKLDLYAALVEIMSDYDVEYLRSHPPVGLEVPSKRSCTARCDCDAPTYDRARLDGLRSLRLCNTNPWPPTGPVEIDGPARLRAEPNGVEIAMLPAFAQVHILEDRKPWYRISWGHLGGGDRTDGGDRTKEGDRTKDRMDEGVEGWTHAANLNLAPSCKLDPERPPRTEDGRPLVEFTREDEGLEQVVSAFGRSLAMGVISSEQSHSLFGTNQSPLALALFVGDSDMYEGGFWLLGPAPPQGIPRLDGRRSLHAIRPDGTIELTEDFHCMSVKHVGRVDGDRWRRISVTFSENFRKQTILDDHCYVHPTESSKSKLPVVRGTPVELLGITTDGGRIRVRLPQRPGEVFLPAGEVSRRCLSAGSGCAG